MHPPTPPNPYPSPQNTLHHRPVAYTRCSPCTPDSKSIPLATLPVTPCPSAGAPLPIPARQLPVTTWLQRACTQAKPHPVRISQRSVCNRQRRFRQSRNLRHLLRLHIAKIKHHLQYLFRFFFPCRRQRNIVRIRSHRTVKMILRHRVERFPPRSQPPKTAAGWFAPFELFQSRRRGIQKSHRHRSPPQSHRCRDSFFQFSPCRSHRSLSRLLLRIASSWKEYHSAPFEPLASKKTAKIAVISTCANKKLHFSCIFRPITLAFSYRVRYSPLGSSFFAHFQG
jgi:hypothetical protein